MLDPMIGIWLLGVGRGEGGAPVNKSKPLDYSEKRMLQTTMQGRIVEHTLVIV